MVSVCKIILILLWRRCKERISTKKIIIFEFISPSLIFFLLFLNSSSFKKPPNKQTRLQETEPIILQNEPYRVDVVKGNPALIMYTPDSPLAHTLMEEVGLRLNLRRLEQFDHNARGYYAFPNGTLELSKPFIDKMKESTAIVTFNDLEGASSWPKVFNYTIRMKNDFMLHVYESMDDIITPHSRFGDIYEPFTRLQWAIDSSYLKLVTGSDVPQIVTLQEFPFVNTQLSDVSSQALVVCALLGFTVYLTMLICFLMMVSAQNADRRSGMVEMVKLSGVSTTTYAVAEVLNLLPMGILYAASGALFLTLSDTPLLEYTNPMILFFALFSYFISIVALAFGFVYAFHTNYVMTLAVITYVFSSILTYMLSTKVSGVLLYVVGVFAPHYSISKFFLGPVLIHESNEILFTFSHLTKAYAGFSTLSLFVMMWLQTLLYLLIAWYFTQVRPGQYGVAKPWDFCFRACMKKQVSPDEVSEEVLSMERDERYFEPPPQGAEPGIRIVGVSKVFNSQRALNNVSFDVYRGEITVLLGHNGAGKTTLMNIITGMYSPTSGSIVVNTQSKGSGRVGFCPQFSFVWPSLDAKTHVMFFALLGGQSKSQAKKSSLEILSQVGLDEKIKFTPPQLSGGQQRRLQLAMALAGSGEVLVLDEPTSGLDVETRRGLWDMLLSLRGSRTLLLTTHFMEEADALGDRVAALHAGELRCHATPMFLKKSVGTGYRLSLTTEGLPNEPEITSLVTGLASGATLKEQTYNSVSYNLPSKDSSQLPELFTQLEQQREQFAIVSIGIGLSTLEEVFLALCSDSSLTTAEELTDEPIEEEATYRRVEGFSLLCQQFVMLIKRHYYYIKHNYISFLLLQVLLPLFAIVLFSYNTAKKPATQALRDYPVDLNIYADMPEKNVLYRVDGEQEKQALRSVAERFGGVTFTETNDVAQAIQRVGMRDKLDLNKYLVGVEINDTDAKVLYSTTVRHAAPVGLNLLSNVLAARLVPWGAAIAASNRPLRVESLVEPLAKTKQPEPMTALTMISWLLMCIWLILIASSQVMLFLQKEEEQGARHLHQMAGCPGYLHYFATLVFYSTMYFVLLGIPFLLCLNFDYTDTITEAFGPMIVIVLLGTIAYIAFCDVCARLGRGMPFMIMLTFGAGFVTAMIDLAGGEMGLFATIYVGLAGALSPPHVFMKGAGLIASAAHLNARCRLDKPRCRWYRNPPEDLIECCASATFEAQPYFDMRRTGKQIIILVIQIVVYSILCILSNRGIVCRVRARIARCKAQPLPERGAEASVREEATYVAQAITEPPTRIQDALLVYNIRKGFYKWCRCRYLDVVKGVTFSVKKGECFGVLGVNGAGKTSTFRVIVGQYCPVEGARVADSHFDTQRQKYLTSLSYCPQFFGLDDFLTGRQTLELLMTMRGFNEDTIRRETDTWLVTVGLQKAANRAVDGYSGGMSRRIATAAALCVGAPVTLLDEPTSGVDVGARRRVWAALKRGLRQRRAIIITSHSMDEMEALCNRIAILSRGRVATLGSAASLRAQHARGHSVILKVRHRSPEEDETDAADSLNKLKEEFQGQFDSTLRDEHATTLHYHINESLAYSALFAALEALKSRHPALEDYAVSETTLEEVFLSYAHRDQRAEEGQV